ncbi:MAG: DUF983 domain-containing protein [Alphaproteobacteria bacterium]|nr:DUF983 domain-containing protein [Alphaproteobacteria bacterium]
MHQSLGSGSVTIKFKQRSVWDGFRRGLGGKCPDCGKGPLFTAYLKIAPSCPSCGHAVGEYHADDGPAYFTILIVGHLVVGPMLFLDFVRTWPVVWVWALLIPCIIGLSLFLLPRVKGAFVGVQWAVGDRSAA